MPVEITVILIIAICTFILGTYGYFVFLSFKRKKQWEELYALIRSKCALITELINIVKDTYSRDAEILGVMTGALNAFIMAKTPVEATSADKRMQQALHALERLMEKYPLIKNSGDYGRIVNETIKIDEKMGFLCQFYNNAAAVFNSRVKRMPFSIVAGIFNIKAVDTLDIGIKPDNI